MRTQLIVAIALFGIMPLTGCASMIRGPYADVQFTSQVNGAQVTVKDRSGSTVFAGTTPATAKLKRGAGYFQPAKYTVTFAKEGYQSKEQPIKTGISGWYVGGNLIFGLFGGMIGWLVVDPLTGAMWTLEGTCCGQLVPATSASASDGMDLKIIAMDQVPPNLRSHLRRVQ